VTVQRREAERVRRDLDDADGAVPGAGHAHEPLVAHCHPALVAECLEEAGEAAGRDGVGVGADAIDELPRAERRAADASPVAPAQERPGTVLGQLDAVAPDAGRQRRRGVVGQRPGALAAVHGRDAPRVVPRGQQDARGPAGGREKALGGYGPGVVTKTLHDAGLPSWALHGGSLASVGLCLNLWIRAKTVDQEARGNAERRALFVGLWPPMLWLMGDSLERRERSRLRR
jgi:hypothetical protein